MTIKIFIGCPPNGEDAEAQAVLEYTLRYYCYEDLDITWMKLSNQRGPFHGWNTIEWSTPFSPFRWCIPELCNFLGRAIYMDCDVICMANISDLWNQNMQGKAVLVQDIRERFPIRTCISLFDCEKIKSFSPQLPSIEQLKKNRDAMLRCNWILSNNLDKVGEYSGKWNSVDLKGSSLSDPELKMIHCSSISHQPHQIYAVDRLAKYKQKHWYDGLRFQHWEPSLIQLFDDLLQQAKKAGFKPENYEPYLDEFVFYKIQSYKNRKVKGYA